MAREYPKHGFESLNIILMDYNSFVGIDISKKTFDLVLIQDNQIENPISRKFSNDSKGIVNLQEFMVKNKLNARTTLFCMEHTGIYCRSLSFYLAENSYNVWIEMPVNIIRSLGLQRGKSDIIDAKRIAEYACRFKDKAKLWQPPREIIIDIKDILALRERLVDSRSKLQQPIKELIATGHDRAAKMIEDSCKETLAALTMEIEQIDKDLDNKINKDSNLRKIFGLATSVVGIGKFTALFLICSTNEFTLFQNAKQLACYCGVAPFEYTSGTSVKGKTRVSNFANKQLKKLLHMGALAAISSNREIADYYQRKVAEGKNKMLVLNAVRNKLIHRLCAVMQRETPFQLNWEFA